MIKIPNKPGEFKQLGDTDVLGNIWSSFNLDLTTNVGRLRVAPRGIIVSKSTDGGLTTMTTPVAFRMFATNATNQRIWAIAGGMFYNTGRPNDTFTLDSSGGVPTVGPGSDMELFNNALYVVGTTEIAKFDGSSWSVVGSGLGTPNTTTCVYAGRFYYAKNNASISSLDLSDANSNPSGTPNTIPYTLNLSNFGVGGATANTITAIRATSNRIWIATIDKTSQNYSAGRAGKIFEWDGVSTQANKVYYLDSIGAMSMVIKDDTPYIMDADGKLLAFNGSAFVKIAELPISPQQYLRNPTNTITQSFIHPRGMTVRNERIMLLINNIVDDSTGSIIENLPSGVWEYDKDMGLYHKYSASHWKNDGITIYTDYAQNRVVEVGALFSAKSTNSLANGDLLFGVKYYQTTTDLISGIFINDTADTIKKVGYFVTTKIDSQNVEDVWQKAYVVHKQLLAASDRIELKYRTVDVTPTEVDITWTSQSTFTTTSDISAYVIGDEIEVTAGTGSGQCEHITNIVVSGGVYTVALNNTVTGAYGVSKARFQKWKLIVETNPNNLYVREFPISDATTSWIQLKCVMYFTGQDEFNNLQLINKAQLPSV